MTFKPEQIHDLEWSDGDFFQKVCDRLNVIHEFQFQELSISLGVLRTALDNTVKQRDIFQKVLERIASGAECSACSCNCHAVAEKAWRKVTTDES